MDEGLQERTKEILFNGLAKIVMASLISETIEEFRKQGKYFHRHELETYLTNYVETKELKGRLRVDLSLVYESGSVLCRIFIDDTLWYEFLVSNIVIEYLRKLGLWQE